MRISREIKDICPPLSGVGYAENHKPVNAINKQNFFFIPDPPKM